MIEFACPSCGNTFRVGDEHAGRKGFCRSCRQVVEVPLTGDALAIEDMPPSQRVRRLAELLNEAEKRYEAKREAYGRLYEKTMELKRRAAEATALRRELRSTRARLEEAQAHLERATLDARNHGKAMGTLESQFDARNTEAGELRETLARVRRERDQLRSALEGAREGLRERDVLRQTLEEARADRDRMTARAAKDRDAADALDGVRAERDQAREVLEQERMERAELREAVKEATARLEKQGERLRGFEAARKRVAELESFREAAQHHAEELNERISRLTLDLQDASGALRSAQARADAHGRRTAQAEKELARARAQLAERDAQLDELAQQAQEYAGTVAERDRLAAELEEARRHGEELRHELARVADSGGDARAQSASVSLEVDEAARGLEAERRAHEETRAEARAERERAESLAAELADARREAASVPALEEEIEGLNERLAEAEASVARLSSEVVEASQAVGSAEAREAGAIRERERLLAEVATLRRERDDRAAALARAEKRLAELEDILRAAASSFAEDEAPPGTELIVPELVPDEEDDREMLDTLLRFIRPGDRE
jgi:chromosome segregation ATPase